MVAKSLSKLSSDELFKIATERKYEEQRKEKERNRAEISLLREKKKKLTADYRKKVATLDKKINQLGGRAKTGKKRSQGATAAIMQILSKEGELSTKTIRAQLDSQGIPTSNLTQTLAYLKRTKRVTSPRRGVYKKKK